VPLLSIGGLPIGATTSNYTYATDIQGSVAAIYDSHQALATAYSYDPYGTVISNAPNSVVQPYRFQGQYQDSTGLYKVGGRYYDPSTGRWLQPDPVPHISSSVESNPYVFAGNDPVNASDATGFDLDYYIGAHTAVTAGIILLGGGRGAVVLPLPDGVTEILGALSEELGQELLDCGSEALNMWSKRSPRYKADRIKGSKQHYPVCHIHVPAFGLGPAQIPYLPPEFYAQTSFHAGAKVHGT
jgi:RHS repeat-associated protein